MMRKLAIALSLVSAMGTGTANALGLGEATVKSSLNQPLSAEIELVNIRDLEQNEILPGLASREEFSKANIERLFLLSDIRFDVVQNAKGNSVIKLSTTKPIREPFLNFLVEVIWPSGRLLREYALLIDPPVFSEDQPAPITPVIIPEDRSVVQVPDVYGKDTGSLAGAAIPPGQQVQYDGETYGPIANNDTLWNIALKVRADKSQTPQQVMIALQQKNPEAFVGGNINRIKAGHVLRVPTPDEVAALTPGQAYAAFAEHNRAFKEGGTVSRPVDGVGKAATPTDSVAAPGRAEQLKIVVAESNASDADTGTHGGAATKGSGTSNNLSVALEKLDRSERENTELSSRVKDLEDQLQTLQRLLTLKDDQLADLQGQLGAEATETDAVSSDRIQSDAVNKKVEEVQAEVESDASSSELAEGGEAKVDGGTDSSASETAMNASEPMAVDGADKVEDSSDVSSAAPVAKPKQVVSSVRDEPVEEPSWMDEVLSNPLYLAGGGAALVVLALGLVVLSRQSAKREQDFYENLAIEEQEEDQEDVLGLDAKSDIQEKTSADEKEDPVAEADVYIAYGRLDQAASVLEAAVSAEPGRTDTRLKLLEVYKQSNDLTSFFKQFGEIESLGDDEVLTQAELIKGDLDDSDLEPEVSIDDLEKDLLAGGFDGKEKEDSDNSIDFSSVAVETPDEAEEDLVSADDSLEDSLDVDFDIGELDLDEPMNESEEALVDDEDLELDIEENSRAIDEVLAEAEDLEEETLEDELAKIDLDFESGSSDAGLDEELDAVASSLDLEETDDLAVDEDLNDDLLDLDNEVSELEGDSDLEAMDADLSLDELDAELDAELASLDLSDEEEIDDIVEELEEVAKDLADEDLQSDEAAADLGTVGDELDELELDESLSEDLGLSLDTEDDLLAAAEIDQEALLAEDEAEENEEFDFLTGTDEAATKLDLARAYIDMGDAEGAKDILQEVSLEGNEEQQEEAKKLLKDLD